MYKKYVDRGCEVFAVSGGEQLEDWKPFLRKHNLLNWINVFPRTINEYQFVEDYDVTGTPKFFLLDENKTIVAKKLSLEGFLQFMDDRIAEEG